MEEWCFNAWQEENEVAAENEGTSRKKYGEVKLNSVFEKYWIG